MSDNPTYAELELRIADLEHENQLCKDQIQELLSSQNDLQETEDQVLKRESLLCSLIRFLPDLVWLKDIHGVYLGCNKMFEKLYGVPEASIVGKTDYDFVNKELADFFREKDKAAIALGGPSLNEEELTFADNGSKVLVETIKTPMFDSSGELIGVLGVARDITRRRAMEENLKRSESTYRNLLDNLNAGVVVHAPDTSIILVNPKACSLLGLSEEQMMGKKAFNPQWKILHKNGTLMPVEEYPVNRMLASKKPLNNLVVGVNREGGADVAWLLVNGFLAKDSTGQIEQVIVSFIDITEPKKSEQALRESEERFRALHNASFGGIAIHDKGYILECNKGLSAITGYEHDELIDMDGLMLISDNTRGLVTKNIQSGYEKPYEAEGVRKNGEIYPLRLEARNIPYKGKSVRVVEFRDITRRKNAEMQMKSTLAEKETLLRELYHRTKNNMQVIVGLLDLQSKASNEEEVTTVFDGMKGRINAMALVHQKLYQSQDLSHINLKDYFRELIETLLVSFHGDVGGVNVVQDIEEIQVVIDVAIPCGLLVNELFSNVFKHAFADHEAGEVFVQLYKESNEDIVLEFKDNGSGVGSDFDMKKQQTLGLRIMHMIVEHQLGGQINFNTDNGVHCIARFNNEFFEARV